MKQTTARFLKNFSVFLLGCFILASGVCAANLARLGVAPLDACILNLAEVLNSTYGTINGLIGVLLVGVQIAVCRKVKLSHLAQLGLMCVFSMILDLVMYYLIGTIGVESLPVRLVLFVAANLLICLGIATLLNAGMVSFPQESSMALLHERFGIPVSRLKYGYDAVWLTIALLFGLTGGLEDLRIGIGTAVMLLLHGWLVNVFFNLIATRRGYHDKQRV